MTAASALPPGPALYPWGLPALLAAEGSLFSFNLQVFKLCNIAMFLLLTVALFRLGRRFLPGSDALAVACMLAFNPILLHYCNHVLTEIPFTLVSVCAFLAMRNRNPTLLTGVLAFAAFTLRTNGVLLLPAATLSTFLPNPGERAWRRPSLRALAIPYLVFVLLYAIWSIFFPGGGATHLEALQAISLGTLRTNLFTYPVSLFDFFTAGHYSAIAAILLWPLLLAGAVRSWPATAHLSLYSLLTLILYILWPAGQGYRFMIPVTPFVLLLLASGLVILPPLLARSLRYGIPLLFLLTSIGLIATHRLPREKWHPYDPPSTEMFQWVRSNTPPEAVIAFFKPRAMHLLAGRLSITAEPADLTRSSYLVYTKERTWNEDQPSLERYRAAASLTQTFENSNFVIYRIAH